MRAGPRSGVECVFASEGVPTRATHELASDFLPPINRILIFDDLNVLLINDTINSIEIQANELLYSHIEYQLINDSLIIRNNNPYNWTSYNDTIKIRVHTTKSLNHIENHGTGNIYSKDTLYYDRILLLDPKIIGRPIFTPILSILYSFVYYI